MFRPDFPPKKKTPDTTSKPEIEVEAFDDSGESPEARALFDEWLSRRDDAPIIPDDRVFSVDASARPADWRERLQTVAASRRGRLVLALTAAIYGACQYDAQPDSKASTESAAVDQYHGVELSEKNGEYILTVNAEYTVRISDYELAEQWNGQLPAELEATFVDENLLYQFYVDTFHDQYTRSLDHVDYKHLADTTTAYGANNKYLLEPARMPAQAYPSYYDTYGEMNLGDDAYVRERVETVWLQSAQDHFGAEQFKTVEDLDQLDIAQWMVIIKAPATMISYDDTYVSSSANYDAVKTDHHMDKSIDQLIIDGVGVCRDYERMNVTSYALANEQFQLAERGLLYIPQINIADARHTRGTFVLATTDTELVMVGVDATAAGWNEMMGFTSAADTSVWQLQQYGKEFLANPADTAQTYADVLGVMRNELPATATAIMQRELVIANLTAAEQAEANADSGQQRQYLEAAFNSLQTQLVTERAMNLTDLSGPARSVPLYDLFLVIGEELDRVDQSAAKGTHGLVARQHFIEYLSSNPKVNVEAARRTVELIDQAKGKQRQQYYELIIKKLKELAQE